MKRSHVALALVGAAASTWLCGARIAGALSAPEPGGVLTIAEPGQHASFVQVEQSDDGGFLVAWQREWNPTTGGFRRLEPDGSPATEPGGLTVPPMDIAAIPGGFWVVGSQLWDYEVLLQRYDSNGDSAGPPFQVAATPLYYSYETKIETSEDERFMVVWYEEWCGPLDLLCYSNGGWARSFDPEGDPLSAPFALDLAPEETETDVVSVGPDAFVVSASDYYTQGATVGRAIDSVGEPLGNPFFLDGAQAVERLTSGDLVAAWTQRPFPSDNLFVRRYSPSGVPQSPIVEVAGCAPDSECLFRRAFAIEAGLHDDFLVVWQEELEDSDNLYARWYGATMNGSESMLVAALHSGPDLIADVPAAQVGLDGSFLVVWDDFGGVFGRFVTGPALFADGFESGDTSEWSATVP